MNTELDELESLLLLWEDGTLDDQGVERVRELLRSSPQAREYYLQQQMLCAALFLEADAGLPLSASDPNTVAAAAPQHNSQGNRNLSRLAVLAAMIVLCVIVGRLIVLEVRHLPSVANMSSDHPSGMTDEATSTGIALVTRLVDVVWGTGSDSAGSWRFHRTRPVIDRIRFCSD